MKMLRGLWPLCFFLGIGAASAQVPKVEPRIVTEMDLEGKVTVVEVAARYVTAIRLPEAVNSVVVGDPSAFQVEHSEREPRLVFVKALSTKPSETNVLISTAGGHEVSLLLSSQGENNSPNRARVDFLLKYETSRGFFVAPSALPFALVGATIPLTEARKIEGREIKKVSSPGDGASLVFPAAGGSLPPRSAPSTEGIQSSGLNQFLEQQERAPLPVLYGQRVGAETESGDRVRAGVSRVIDGGQQVVVLFSVINPTKHAILLMPPQLQLGGRTTSRKLIRPEKWSTAEQLQVLDFRLNRRRLGPSERADGVVVFERPPYKQSNEMLLLQVAESGAVDRPALAPIGFGVSSSREDQNGNGK
ncbi:MAG: hypothetical protein ACYDHE_08225 [Candidatus Acidiferrales bacterium]